MVAEYGDALKSSTVREFVLKYDKAGSAHLCAVVLELGRR